MTPAPALSGRKARALSLILALAAPPAPAETGFCSAGYITDLRKGEGTIDRDGSKFQAVNVFSYEFNGACRVVPKSPWVPETAERLKHDRRLILVDVVNEIQKTPGPCQWMSSGQMLHHVLSDPARRAEHIQELLPIAALAHGLEIDYEHVLPETTGLLTLFIQELRAALPSDKKLAMVVQPKTFRGGEQGRTVDWRGVEPHVDYIRVMAYYYAWNTSPPGPVITYAKLAQVADYILNDPAQSIPRAKARILLSLYGWDWPVEPRAGGKLVRYEQAMALAQAAGVVPERDPVEDTLRFQYRDAQGVLHEVWFDDAVGIQKRVQLLMDKGFPAIDLWHLNTGDPALWDWFKPLIRDCPSLTGRASPLPPPPPTPKPAETPYTLPGAGPNPWSAGKDPAGIRFFGVPEGGDVGIYTSSGRFIKRLPDAGGTAEWDLTDEEGRDVPSGLYVFFAAQAEGGRRRGTLTVIR